MTEARTQRKSHVLLVKFPQTQRPWKFSERFLFYVQLKQVQADHGLLFKCKAGSNMAAVTFDVALFLHMPLFPLG